MSWKKIGMTSMHVMASTISIQLLQWTMMASVAHQEGPKALGLYALAQAIALPLQYLSFLAIRPRYLATGDTASVGSDFLALRIFVPALAFAAALPVIYAWYGDDRFVLLCACVFFLKYIEGIYDLAYARLQKIGESRSLAKVSIVRSLVSIVLFLLVYRLSGMLYLSMICVAVQQAAICLSLKSHLIAIGTNEGRDAGRTLRRVILVRAKLAHSLLPFAMSTVVASLSSSLPRLLLNDLVGARELGYFAAVISFVSIGQIAVGSVGQSLLHPLAVAVSSRDRRTFWSRLLWPVLLTQLMCGAGAVIAYLAGPTLIVVIYGPNFTPAIPLLVVGSIVSGPFFAATLFTAALFAVGLKYNLLLNQVGTLAVVLVLTGLLVRLADVPGMFWALGIAGVLQSSACYVSLRRHWHALVSRPATSNTREAFEPSS